jgi:hypothetical protein
LAASDLAKFTAPSCQLFLHVTSAAFLWLARKYLFFLFAVRMAHALLSGHQTVSVPRNSVDVVATSRRPLQRLNMEIRNV